MSKWSGVFVGVIGIAVGMFFTLWITEITNAANQNPYWLIRDKGSTIRILKRPPDVIRLEIEAKQRELKCVEDKLKAGHEITVDDKGVCK